MDQIKIFDNFLSTRLYRRFCEIVESEDFPWYLSGPVAYEDGTNSSCPEKYDYQFCHSLYESPAKISNSFNIIDPILDKIDIAVLLNAKINCNPATDNIIEHGFHVDVPHDLAGKVSYTGVYYINSNNGYTIFKDGTKVHSKKNRLVIFPTTLNHTGSTCTDSKYRLVLNFNFIPRF